VAKPLILILVQAQEVAQEPERDQVVVLDRLAVVAPIMDIRFTKDHQEAVIISTVMGIKHTWMQINVIANYLAKRLLRPHCF
jgi:hypothetical protein